MTALCANCSSALDEGSLFCPQCGTAVAVHSGIAETGSTDAPIFKSFEARNDLNGIGGWLILPAIGLAISPFMSLFGIVTDIMLLTGNHPSLFANHPSLTSLLTFEVLINTAFLVAVIYLNVLFYTKNRIFPKCIIAFYAAQCFLMLADHLAATAVFPSADLSPSVIAIVRSFIGAAIWIPYFLNSKRVEATFVN